MGNTDIALPADKVISTTDKTIGIPTVTSPLESRSVLGNVSDSSPDAHDVPLNMGANKRSVVNRGCSTTEPKGSMRNKGLPKGSMRNKGFSAMEHSTEQEIVETKKQPVRWADIVSNRINNRVTELTLLIKES